MSSNQLMYISWNFDTGFITRISGQPIPDSISVPLKDVEDLVLGNETFKKYKVKYNTKDKKYELVNNDEFEIVTSRINDKLYIINEREFENSDISIVQDIKHKKWIFKSNDSNLPNKSLWFSVIHKDNPNILIRSFNINLSEVSNGIEFEFTNDESDSSLDVSIITTRAFDNYEFLQVTHESN